MKKPLRIRLTIIFVVIIYFSSRLHPVWSRTFHPSWNGIIVFIGLLIGLLLALLFLYSLTQLFLNSNYTRFISYLPIILVSALLLDLYFNPLNIDLDKLYGKIQYKAYYEGSMSGATFTLRDNNRFEIYYTAAPFHQTYWKGKYTQNGDTLFLAYIGTEPPFEWGKKVIKIEGRGIVVSKKDNEFHKIIRPFFWEVEENN